jgi:hypothetical protein
VDRESDQFLAPEDAVIYDVNGIYYGDCSHTAGDSKLYFWRPGFYYVYSNLYHQEACQFTTFLNGVPVPGTTKGSPTGASQNSSAGIIQIKTTDFITPTSASPSGFAAAIEIVNHTSFVPIVTLNGLGGSGSASPQITATVTVILILDTSVISL